MCRVVNVIFLTINYFHRYVSYRLFSYSNISAWIKPQSYRQKALTILKFSSSSTLYEIPKNVYNEIERLLFPSYSILAFFCEKKNIYIHRMKKNWIEEKNLYPKKILIIISILQSESGTLRRNKINLVCLWVNVCIFVDTSDIKIWRKRNVEKSWSVYVSKNFVFDLSNVRGDRRLDFRFLLFFYFNKTGN